MVAHSKKVEFFFSINCKAMDKTGRKCTHFHQDWQRMTKANVTVIKNSKN